MLFRALELTDDFFFTAADIEGGRGGETSPSEGDDPFFENGLWGSGVTEEETPTGSDTSSEEQPDQEPSEEPVDAPVNPTTEPGDETDSGYTEDPVHSSQTSESTSDPQKQDTEPSQNFLLKPSPSTQSDQAAQSEGSERPSQLEPSEESEQHSLSQPSEDSDPSAQSAQSEPSAPLQPSSEASDSLSPAESPDSQPSAAESTDGIQPSATPAGPSGKLQILIGSAIVLCILIGSSRFP